MTSVHALHAPSPRRGLHLIVVDLLGKRIVGGDLVPGDSLTTESELSAELGVSRTVVREAVKVLAAKGLVEVRPKTGTRVLPRSHWNLADHDVLEWSTEAGPDEDLLRDLFEVRAVIEPQAAALAATRRTEDEMARLEQLLVRLAAAADDADAYIEVDLELHTAILRATHNELLARLTNTLSAALKASRGITTRVPGGAARSIPLHAAIVEGIREGDPVAVRGAVEALIASASRDMAAVLHGTEEDPIGPTAVGPPGSPR